MSEGKSISDARRFWTFVLVGGFAALVNWGSRIFISARGVPFEVAVVVAYMFGMAIAYLLSRTFVFERSDRSISSEVWRFILVNLVALIVVWMVSVGLEGWLLPSIGWTWRRPEVAHALGVAAPVVTSYLGHRYFTFRRQVSPEDHTHERTP